MLRVVGVLPVAVAEAAVDEQQQQQQQQMNSRCTRVTYVPVDDSTTVHEAAHAALKAFAAAEAASISSSASPQSTASSSLSFASIYQQQRQQEQQRENENDYAADQQRQPLRQELRLVVETQRNRIQSPDIVGGIGEERGEFSQILEGSWLIKHYISSSTLFSGVSPPWSVVAYLCLPLQQQQQSKFFVPPPESAPPLPDVRGIQRKVAETGFAHVERKNDDAVSTASLLPGRIQAGIEAQRPVQVE